MYYVLFTFIDRFRVNVAALNIQQVGKSLTLECIVTDLINASNNSLEIMWTSTSNNALLRRVNSTFTVIDGLPVYRDSYTIAQLNTSDQGRMIRCTANSPPVTESSNIILNVIGT